MTTTKDVRTPQTLDHPIGANMMWAHEQLSYDQERSLLSQALEVYAERPDQRDPEDAVFEIVASWAPVMNRDVREQWVEERPTFMKP
jgi:hypothetical protein